MRLGCRIRSSVFLLWVASIASFAVWWPSLGQGLWLDDDLHLARTEAIAEGVDGAWADAWVFRSSDVSPLWYTPHEYSVRYFRPVVSVSLLVDRWLWPGNATGHHATNLLFHILAATLVGLLAGRLVDRADVATRRRVAGFGAALFAVHPAHMDALGWVMGRADSLAAVWVLACVAAHLVRLDRGGLRWLSVEVVLAVLGLLSKESAVVLPVVLLVHGWAGYPGVGAERRLSFGGWRGLIRAVGPVSAVTAGFLVLRFGAFGMIGTPAPSYLVTVADPDFLAVLVRNLCLEWADVVLPLPLGPLRAGPVPPLPAVPAALVVCVLFFSGIYVCRRRFPWRRAALGLALAASSLLLTLPVTPSRRLLYLPVAGSVIALLAGFGPRWFAKKVGVRWAALGLSFLAICGFGRARGTARCVNAAETELHALVEEAEIRDRAGPTTLWLVDLPAEHAMTLADRLERISGRSDLDVVALTVSPEPRKARTRFVPGGGPGVEWPVGWGPGEEGAGSTVIHAPAAGELLVRREGGVFMGTVAERSFLWGDPVPQPGQHYLCGRTEVVVVESDSRGIASLRAMYRGPVNELAIVAFDDDGPARLPKMEENQ